MRRFGTRGIREVARQRHAPAAADYVWPEYDFAVKTAGAFDVRARIGFEFAGSAFAWRIDGAAWLVVTRLIGSILSPGRMNAVTADRPKSPSGALTHRANSPSKVRSQRAFCPSKVWIG